MRKYSEDNPDLDITIPWFEELAKKEGLIVEKTITGGNMFELKFSEEQMKYLSKVTIKHKLTELTNKLAKLYKETGDKDYFENKNYYDKLEFQIEILTQISDVLITLLKSF